MTTIINLFGGPGLGKSTTAADLYATMKKRLLSVELVREAIKEAAYNKEPINFVNKIKYMAKQIDEEFKLFGKVDYIVTDSPVHLYGIYGQIYNEGKYIPQLMLEYNQYLKDHNIKTINILLDRHKKYDQNGRYETEEQARGVDAVTKQYLINNLDFTEVCCEDSLRIFTIMGLL